MLKYSWWQDLESDPFEWVIPEQFNIGEACSDLQPRDDAALIVDSGESSRVFTFGDLSTLSRQFVTVLDSHGLEAEDRVAIMVAQGIEVLTAHLGGFRGGFVTVPLSVKFGTDAVAYRLENSGSRVLVIDAANYDRLDMDVIWKSGVERVLVVDAGLSSTFEPSETVSDFCRLSPRPNHRSVRWTPLRSPRPSLSTPREPPETPRALFTATRCCWGT